jgi:hypothetical protein
MQETLAAQAKLLRWPLGANTYGVTKALTWLSLCNGSRAASRLREGPTVYLDRAVQSADHRGDDLGPNAGMQRCIAWRIGCGLPAASRAL